MLKELINHLKEPVIKMQITKMDQDTLTELDKQDIVVMNMGSFYIVLTYLFIIVSGILEYYYVSL